MTRKEERLQSECFQWFWNNFPDERRMLFHVDNNSWNEIIGARKKALGVCAGVSDFIYIRPGKLILFMEAKVPGGEQSEYQKEFERKVAERGFLYLIFNSVEDFQDIIFKLHE